MNNLPIEVIERYINTEQIIADDLLRALDIELDICDEEGYRTSLRDIELIGSLINVLQYYMSEHSYEIMMKTRKEKLERLGF